MGEVTKPGEMMPLWRRCQAPRMQLPTTPYRGTEAKFLAGNEPGQAAVSGSIFLGTRPKKMCHRKAPAGLAEKQQPQAALEAARHLARQWSRPGEGLRARSAGTIAWF